MSWKKKKILLKQNRLEFQESILFVQYSEERSIAVSHGSFAGSGV